MNSVRKCRQISGKLLKYRCPNISKFCLGDCLMICRNLHTLKPPSHKLLNEIGLNLNSTQKSN